ncbi:MAG: YegP family protein [Anaerolineales bacterium]
MKHPKFVIFTGKDGQFYFRLTARNGEPILASEGYKSKSGCENGIQSVKDNASEDGQYKRLEAANGEFYFRLLAKNNEVIGRSETYMSKQGRDNGIKSVMENAPKAPIEDTTV